MNGELPRVTFVPTVHRIAPLLAMCALAACVAPPVPARLEGVAPSTVDGRVATLLELSGLFPPAVQLDLDQPSRSVASTHFRVGLTGPRDVALAATWLDEARISAVLEAGTPAGRYSLALIDPRGVTSTLVDAVEVVDADGGLADGGRLDGGCAVTFEDADGDGWGADATAAEVCGADRVSRGGDCNDADALTHPGALEVCNLLDDDCDGIVDEGACPLDAGWNVRTDTGGSSDDWVTASAYAKGAVWIAGKDRVMNRPGKDAFVSHSSGCPMAANASWASSSGLLAVGTGNGGHGALVLADVAGKGCFGARDTGDPVAGVVGFEVDGGVTLAAATRNGSLFRFTPGQPPVELGGQLPQGAHLEDLHGASLESLVAVGSNESNLPRAYRWVDGGWAEESLPGRDTAYGVWMLTASSGFAVGGHGLAAELRDGGWTRLPGLDGATLRSVRAFRAGRVYTVEAEGRVRRWDGQRWSVLLDLGAKSPLYDITGTSEEDLWVVGSNGLVAHWPR